MNDQNEAFSKWVQSEAMTRVLVRLDLTPRPGTGHIGYEVAHAALAAGIWDDDGKSLACFHYQDGKITYQVTRHQSEWPWLVREWIRDWEGDWLQKQETIFRYGTPIPHSDQTTPPRMRWEELRDENILVLQHLARIHGALCLHNNVAWQHLTFNDDRDAVARVERRLLGLISQINRQAANLLHSVSAA